jgi:serpin B
MSASALSQQLNPQQLNQPSNQAIQVNSMIHANRPTSSPAMSQTDTKLVTANTRFGFKLFSQLVQSSAAAHKNIMISPTSVATALSMVYNGAASTTQQAIAKTLELPDLNLTALNQANATLATALQTADPEVTLNIANSLWGNAGFSFNPDFLQRNQKFYNAEITSLDFASAAAVGQINAWVSRNTNGKITRIVERISPQQTLFLLNAVYFKGNWTVPFDPNQTKEHPFTRSDGSQKSHPLMSQQGSYAYYETDQFQAISLPYGNQHLSMYIFLPRPQSSLSQFYQSLNAETWNTWMQQFRKQRGSIQLPKFKFEYENTLNQALTALGMGVAFTGEADFSQISQSATQISEVKHKTFIEVNEAGTEAAAATSIAMSRAAMPVSQPFQMTVDRPFFCAIRDHQTGTLLFVGAVEDPE